MKLNDITKWISILVLVTLLYLMLIICRKHNLEKEMQQKIDDHSEIIDTV